MPQQLALQVQNAIDSRLASNSVDACASGVAAFSSVSQKLLGNIVHYFTKKDWETLHGKKSLQSMQQVVMDRLPACGISHPHEHGEVGGRRHSPCSVRQRWDLPNVQVDPRDGGGLQGTTWRKQKAQWATQDSGVPRVTVGAAAGALGCCLQR